MTHRIRIPFLALSLLLFASSYSSPSAWAEATPSPTAAAVALFEAGHLAEAERAFQALVKSDPKDAVAAHYLGRLAFQKGDFDEAIERLGKAAERAPGRSDYQLWLGRAYGRAAQRASLLRQPSLAGNCREAFEKAVALDAANLDAREDLMNYYLQAPGFMGGGADKAKAQAEEIAQRDALRGHFARAAILLQAKDRAGAERELRAALSSTPASQRARLRLASLLLDDKRLDEAFAVLEEGLKLAPGNAALLYQVGRAAAVSGQRLERGEQALNEFLALSSRGDDTPGPAAAHWRLGGIHEHRGQRDAARAAYREALRLDPKFEQAAKALKALG